MSADGIKTDPEKVKAVKTLPVKVNVKELQGFLGLADYYRKFILRFSSIAVPRNRSGFVSAATGWD